MACEGFNLSKLKFRAIETMLDYVRESAGTQLLESESTPIMVVLSDPKLERFAQALLRHLAKGLTGGKAATQAALEAGYSGSSLASNARKRAQRPDVKRRLVELAAPRLAEAEAELDETMAGVSRNLFRLALKQHDAAEVRPDHTIRAADLLAKLSGAYATQKVEHSLNGLGDRLDPALVRARLSDADERSCWKAWRLCRLKRMMFRNKTI